MEKNCFIAFKNRTDNFALPKQFTFPFYYDPHPLCVLASQELQQYLKTQNEWHHNFGISKNKIEPIGKMFGVLLVQNIKNEIGYLAAFSGKLAGVNQLSFFVPPIYDMLDEDGFYKKEEEKYAQDVVYTRKWNRRFPTWKERRKRHFYATKNIFERAVLFL